MLFFRTTRKSDGKRVENKTPIGLVQNVPDESSAWAEVERLHFPINRVGVRRALTFGDLAQHYAEHELVECSESIRPKAHTTIKSYERVLRNRLLPRRGNRIALGIEPLEVEQWRRALKKERYLANPTLDKTLASCPWCITGIVKCEPVSTATGFTCLRQTTYFFGSATPQRMALRTARKKVGGAGDQRFASSGARIAL